jgi:hypothetical protein
MCYQAEKQAAAANAQLETLLKAKGPLNDAVNGAYSLVMPALSNMPLRPEDATHPPCDVHPVKGRSDVSIKSFLLSGKPSDQEIRVSHLTRRSE